MNKVKLMFFATLRDRAGTKSAEIQLPAGATVGDLRGRVARDYPSLEAALKSALIAVNREYAGEEALIPENAEVALFPPVSGG